MDDNLSFRNFVEYLNEEMIEAMAEASDSGEAQYRLGIRRLAKKFFDGIELFSLERQVSFEVKDVDAWFAGRGASAAGDR